MGWLTSFTCCIVILTVTAPPIAGWWGKRPRPGPTPAPLMVHQRCEIRVKGVVAASRPCANGSGCTRGPCRRRVNIFGLPVDLDVMYCDVANPCPRGRFYNRPRSRCSSLGSTLTGCVSPPTPTTAVPTTTT